MSLNCWGCRTMQVSILAPKLKEILFSVSCLFLISIASNIWNIGFLYYPLKSLEYLWSCYPIWCVYCQSPFNIYIYIYIYIYMGSRHILLKMTDKDLQISFLLTLSCLWDITNENKGGLAIVWNLWCYNQSTSTFDLCWPLSRIRLGSGHRLWDILWDQGNILNESSLQAVGAVFKCAFLCYWFE